jgi:hypothetical protein
MMRSAIVKSVDTVPWRESSRLVSFAVRSLMLSAHVCMACGGVVRRVALAWTLMSRAVRVQVAEHEAMRTSGHLSKEVYLQQRQ